MIRRLPPSKTDATATQATWKVDKPIAQKEFNEREDLKKRIEAKDLVLHETKTHLEKATRRIKELETELASKPSVPSTKVVSPSKLDSVDNVSLIDGENFKVEGAGEGAKVELMMSWQSIRKIFQTAKSMRKNGGDHGG